MEFGFISKTHWLLAWKAATFGIRTDLSLSACSHEEIAAWAM